MATTLAWLEDQDLPALEGPAIVFDQAALCLSPFLDSSVRAEEWTNQRTRPAGRKLQLRRWRQRFERIYGRFVAVHQEELSMMSPPALLAVLEKIRPVGRNFPHGG